MKNETEQNINENKSSMRKYIIVASCFLLLVIVVLVTVFHRWESKSDPASERVIRNAAASEFYRVTRIQKDPNELTDEDFAKITTMYLSTNMGSGGNAYWIDIPTGKPLTTLKLGELCDIKLLKKFTNLQELSLIDITFPKKNIPAWMKVIAKCGLIDLDKRFSIDLKPIKNLTSLKSLNLDSSQISDITPIKEMINLKVLSLSMTQVSNLEPVKHLVNLEELLLYKCKVSNIDFLSELKNLKVLHIGYTAVTDLTPLKSLLKLETLDLSYNQISDIEPLKELKNLRTLMLYKCDFITNEQKDDLRKALPNLTFLR